MCGHAADLDHIGCVVSTVLAVGSARGPACPHPSHFAQRPDCGQACDAIIDLIATSRIPRLCVSEVGKRCVTAVNS